MLEVRGLVKGYGGAPVLAGIDLRIAAGEALVLLGPNGAGKSTLLRVLAGLHKQQGGQIGLDGGPFRPSDPRHRRRIGFAGHESLLYGGLTGRENLLFTADLFALPDAAGLSDRTLDRVGLSRAGHRPVREYSRGMVQRLSLGRALLHQPRLLLLDEPAAGLDPGGIRWLNRTLVEFREEGGALIMSVHNPAQAEPVATRAAFLSRGKLVEAGRGACTAVALEAAYHELFTRPAGADAEGS